MIQILSIVQIIFAVLLILSVLFQQSEAGLGGAFGGSDTDGIHHTRRGFEKFLFISSIVLGILFAVSALLILVLS
ncbi:MAG: preprotein translocase subunit SecG [Candidatus Nomurabacteria bacterium]|nr:preprotein translocase subunit SecG [Candidatus Nomurabacteria bacterium]